MSAAPSETVGRALGVDVGSVRVGIALSDESRTIASPLAVLARAPARQLWSRLRDQAGVHAVSVVVVGLPLRLDGSEGDMARAARAFAVDVERELCVPVALWDERLTSVQAERSLIAAGERRSTRRGRIDTVAAALMLQSWLDAQRSGAHSGT